MQTRAYKKRGAQAAFIPTNGKCGYADFLRAHAGKATTEALLLGLFASDGHPDMLVRDMHAVRYTGGIVECDFGSRIFNPPNGDITGLAPAMLDAKEVLPPDSAIPGSRTALRQFLDRLMLANGREPSNEILIDGWRGGQPAGRAMDGHILRLWKLHETDEALYKALVGGRFAPVLRKLRAVRQSDPVLFNPLRDLLMIQSLIWCAHDAQMVIARIYQTVQFGPLAQNGKSPESVMNALKRTRTALEISLDAFFSDDWRSGNMDRPGSSGMDLARHRNAEVRAVAKRVRHLLGKNAESAMSIERVTELMNEVAQTLRGSDTVFKRTAAPPTGNIMAKHFAAEWYSVPSPLTAMAVVAYRLVQAEVQLPGRIDAMIARIDPVSCQNLPLPPCDEASMPRSTGARVNALMDFYRSRLLREDTFQAEGIRSWKATDAAKVFLSQRGQRMLGDDHGAATDPRRSFYLLDVIPEHRFVAGG